MIGSKVMTKMHTYGKKMARKGRKKVIYKVSFISKRSLRIHHLRTCKKMPFQIQQVGKQKEKYTRHVHDRERGKAYKGKKPAV